jgi:hypothetical protein
MPPPSSVASFASNLVPKIVSRPPLVCRPPPPATSSLRTPSSSIGTPALFRANVESTIVCWRSLWVQTPPPSPFDSFSTTVARVSVKFARSSLVIAAPWSVERFLVNVVSLTNSCASPPL